MIESTSTAAPAGWRAHYGDVIGGVTTFVTMAYIVIVNPGILSTPGTGMSFSGALTSTVLVASSMTLLMGLYARLPFAVAPGMGLNAFFAYTICLRHGVPWQTGLGLLAIVAVVFFALTLGGVRRTITEAVPKTLRMASPVGIGLFIALIGLQQSGVVVGDPATLVTLGDLRSTPVLLGLGGLAVTLALMARGVRAAVFWGMLVTGVAGWLVGLVPSGAPWIELPRGRLPGREIDLGGALRLDLLPLAVVLLFFAVFDAMGTLFAVGRTRAWSTTKGASLASVWR
jgi:adenine/guanine/hypoxanthine permease